VLAAEHLLDLAGLHHLRELLEAGGEIREHVLALAGPLHEHAEVLGAFCQRGNERDFFLDAAPALEDLLRFGLVAPEIGRTYVLFDIGQLLVEASGFKDASAIRRRAC